MKRIFGVILLILNDIILSVIYSCLKDAIIDSKTSKCKHKILVIFICFLGDAWEVIELAFLTLAFGLICLC